MRSNFDKNERFILNTLLFDSFYLHGITALVVINNLRIFWGDYNFKFILIDPIFNSIYLVNDDVIFPGIPAKISRETGKNLNKFPGNSRDGKFRGQSLVDG